MECPVIVPSNNHLQYYVLCLQKKPPPHLSGTTNTPCILIFIKKYLKLRESIQLISLGLQSQGSKTQVNSNIVMSLHPR